MAKKSTASGKYEKAHTTLPPWALAQLEILADATTLTRSALIRLAILDYLKSDEIRETVQTHTKAGGNVTRLDLTGR